MTHSSNRATRFVPRSRAGAGPVIAASVVAGVLLLSLSGSGCGRADQTQSGAPPLVPVTVGTVEQKAMPVSFRAIGNIEPIESVAVRARIGGELQQVFFAEGQAVLASDRLFGIDPRPYRAALAQTEAVLARDQALLAKAEADINRYADLVEQDFVTREQYDQIKVDAAALAAAVAADQANVETAKLNLEYCTITAPVSGRTGNLNVKAGNLVKANDDTPLVTINRTRPIYASFSVPAQLLPKIIARRSAGIRVVATLPGDHSPPAEGTLTFVDNAVDTSTSTVLLKATFANEDERLWPGQFVEVTVILGEEPDRIVCPAPAVQTGQEGQYVFVVTQDRTVELRPVKVNRMDEQDAVIDDGLAPGETVVTDGQLRLVPGATIEVKTLQGSAGTAS